MKPKCSILVLSTILWACQYDSIADRSTLLGSWNVSSDFQYVGIGEYNHPVTYIGQSGDYFIFTTNGKLYIKEGSTRDTLSYQFLSGSVSIASNIYQIESASSHSIILNWPGIITPGGEFARKIVLTR